MRFVRPALGITEIAGVQVLFGYQALDQGHVLALGVRGVLDEAVVPRRMEIAWRAPTLKWAVGGPKETKVDAVAASRLSDRVKRLVDVADELHHEFQSFVLLFARSIRQRLGEEGDAINYAVLVVRRGAGMLVPRQEAIAAVVEAARAHWYIREVPVVRLVAFWANLIGPTSNRGEGMIAEQRAHCLQGLRRQPRLCNGGDDRVALPAPAKCGRAG